MSRLSSTLARIGRIKRALSGTFTWSGTLISSIGRKYSLSGLMQSLTGSLSRLIDYKRSLSGNLTQSGILARWEQIKRPLAGSFYWAGSVAASIGRSYSLSGILSQFTGALTRAIDYKRSLAGSAFNWAGSLGMIMAGASHYIVSIVRGVSLSDFAPHNMTANDAPSPYVASASSEYDEGWHLFAYHACDSGTDDSYWRTINQTMPAWWKIDTGGSHKLYSYSLYELWGPSSPSSWKLYGSNNDVDWVELDSRTDIAAWTPQETKNFICSAYNASYRYFKIIVSAINYGGANCRIDEIYLYEVNPSTPALTLLNGILTKILRFKRSLSGIAQFSGAVTYSGGLTQRALAGILNFVGDISRKERIKKALSGLVNFTGELTAGISGGRSLSGVLRFLGSLSRFAHVSRSLSGIIHFSGQLIGNLLKNNLAGTLTFGGVLTSTGGFRRYVIGLNGAIHFNGELDNVGEIMYYGVANP